MKNLVHSILFTILALGFASCGNPLCKDYDCGTHGICGNNGCECEDGWEIDSDGKCNQKIKCYGVDCGHGACNIIDETCDCDLYYEVGADGKCNALWRDKFLGGWLGTHFTNHGDTVGPYLMTATAGSGITGLTIVNFLNQTCSITTQPLEVTATMFSDHSVWTFATFCPGYNFGTLQWTSIDSARISYSGSYVFNSTIENVSGIFLKQ